MTVPQWDRVGSFRPFLESASPDDKLKLLYNTLLKPRKRLRKLIERKNKLVNGVLKQEQKQIEFTEKEKEKLLASAEI